MQSFERRRDSEETPEPPYLPNLLFGNFLNSYSLYSFDFKIRIFQDFASSPRLAF